MKVITSKSKLACQQIHYGVAVWALDYSPCAPGWMIQNPPHPPPPPPHLTLKSVMKLKVDRKYKKYSEKIRAPVGIESRTFQIPVRRSNH